MLHDDTGAALDENHCSSGAGSAKPDAHDPSAERSCTTSRQAESMTGMMRAASGTRCVMSAMPSVPTMPMPAPRSAISRRTDMQISSKSPGSAVASIASAGRRAVR